MFLDQIKSFDFVKGIFESVSQDPKAEVKGSVETLPNVFTQMSSMVSDQEVKKIDGALDLLIVDRAIDALIKDPNQRKHFLVFQKPETISALKKYQDRLKNRIAKLNQKVDSELAKSATSIENPIDFKALESAISKIQRQNERLKTVRAIYDFYENEKNKVALDNTLLEMKNSKQPFNYVSNAGKREAVITAVGPYDSKMDENTVQIQFLDNNQKFAVSKDGFWKGKSDLNVEEELKKISIQTKDILNQTKETEEESEKAVANTKPEIQKKLSEGFEKVNQHPTEENVTTYLMQLEDLENSVMEPLLKEDIQEAKKATVRKAKSSGLPTDTYSEANIKRLTHNRIIRDIMLEIKSFDRKKHRDKKEVIGDYEKIYKDIATTRFRQDPVTNEDDQDKLVERLDKIKDQKLKEVAGRSYLDDVDMDNLNGLQIKPNADLPLGKAIPIIVTKEHRIEDSPLSKFRKIFWNVAAGALGGGVALTDLSKEISNDMLQRRKAVLNFVNSVASGIASVGGEKSKSQADTLTKNLSYSAYNNKFDVDSNKNTPRKKIIRESTVEEDMIMNVSPEGTGGSTTPGSGTQMPGSIPTMGDPKPATKNSPGSGDDFNPKKKKKKKNVLGFTDFVENKYGKNGKKLRK